MKQIEKNKQEEQELNVWCNTLYNYTKQMVENPTRANKWIFDKACHDEWLLSKFPKHLSSVKAYNAFYELTGKDIRDFDWYSTVKTKTGENIIVHKYFMDEHLTTAYDFKNTLMLFYKQGRLTIDLIKDLIQQQRLCWITREEDKMLTAKGYIKHRVDPLKAYTDCDIEIYDKENEDLENIMKPQFCSVIKNSNGEKGNNVLKRANLNNNIAIRREFFNQLKKHFEENSYFDTKIPLITKENIEYAYIYYYKGLMINVRVKDGVLNDICAYLEGDDAKQIFDKLKENKEEIETNIGYKLVWDRNNNRKATRIGRFGPFSTSPNTYGLCNEEGMLIDEGVKPFDFDLDVDKVANELYNFMKVFIPRVFEMRMKLYGHKKPRNRSKRLADFFE